MDRMIAMTSQRGKMSLQFVVGGEEEICREVKPRYRNDPEGVRAAMSCHDQSQRGSGIRLIRKSDGRCQSHSRKGINKLSHLSRIVKCRKGYHRWDLQEAYLKSIRRTNFHAVAKQRRQHISPLRRENLSVLMSRRNELT